jgi:hypothetical protein
MTKGHYLLYDSASDLHLPWNVSIVPAERYGQETSVSNLDLVKRLCLDGRDGRLLGMTKGRT